MKKQKFLHVSMVILGISVLLLMIACPSPSKDSDSGSTAKVDSGPKAIPKTNSFSREYKLAELQAILPDDLGKKTVKGENTAIVPGDLEYTLRPLQGKGDTEEIRRAGNNVIK